MTESKPEQYVESERPVAVAVRDGQLRVTLQDGRVIETPLEWYPALAQAAPAVLEDVVLLWDGVHWPQADEYLSIRGMLDGVKPPAASQVLPNTA